MTASAGPASMKDEISDKLVQEKAFGLFANAYLAVASKEQDAL